MAEQLKPCPHCGGEARRACVLPGPGERFGCTNCAIDAYTAEDWNRRTTPPATKAMLDAFRGRETQDVFYNDIQSQQLIRAFLAEWPKPDAKGGA